MSCFQLSKGCRVQSFIFIYFMDFFDISSWLFPTSTAEKWWQRRFIFNLCNNKMNSKLLVVYIQSGSSLLLIIGHVSVLRCLLINFQYKPISLQYTWLSVNQPIRINCSLPCQPAQPVSNLSPIRGPPRRVNESDQRLIGLRFARPVWRVAGWQVSINWESLGISNK